MKKNFIRMLYLVIANAVLFVSSCIGGGYIISLIFPSISLVFAIMVYLLILSIGFIFVLSIEMSVAKINKEDK